MVDLNSMRLGLVRSHPICFASSFEMNEPRLSLLAISSMAVLTEAPMTAGADVLHVRRRRALHAREGVHGRGLGRGLLALEGDPPGQLRKALAAGARAAAEELGVDLAGGGELGLDVDQLVLNVARHWRLGRGCRQLLLVLLLLVARLVLVLARHGRPRPGIRHHAGGLGKAAGAERRACPHGHCA
jgi:hypothetical protein